MYVFCCSASDASEAEQLDAAAPPSRRAAAPRYARLGRGPADDDDEEYHLRLSKRAVPTNFRFAGLGKRKVSLAYKAAGLGKRTDDSSDWEYDIDRRVYGARPEADIGGHVTYIEPVLDDYTDARPETDKRRVSTAMRYAGLGKRQHGRGMRYMGVGRS